MSYKLVLQRAEDDTLHELAIVYLPSIVTISDEFLCLFGGQGLAKR